MSGLIREERKHAPEEVQDAASTSGRAGEGHIGASVESEPEHRTVWKESDHSAASPETQD